jgi:subtilisin family serine protease/PKD repeat protein
MRAGRRLNWLLTLTLLLGGLGLLIAAVATPARGAGDGLDKVDPQVLEELATRERTDFFIHLVEKADLGPASQLRTKEEKGRFVFEALRQTAARTQAALRAALDAQGVDYRPFYIANKILVRGGDRALVLDIAARPDVDRITANASFQLPEPPAPPSPDAGAQGVGDNISYVYADDAWALGITGQGIVLAGNDSGLDEDHPAIARHYRGCLDPPACTTEDHNYNWWDATGLSPTDPWDDHGHGTHTTGTMVGSDGDANQIGMAPDAQTIHCRIMDGEGRGTVAGFSECLEWDLAPWDLNGENPRPDLAPDAVNNSWGYVGGNTPQFRDEIAALQAAGILLQVAAGGEGPACATVRSPGDYGEVFTVGAVDYLSFSYPGRISTFSSRGPSQLDASPPHYFPDIMAPGRSVRSSIPGGVYISWTGTSTSAPHVTGLAGLCLSANPALRGQVQTVVQIIKDTANPTTGPVSNCGGDYVTGPNNDWGYGTIHALDAVQACLAISETGTLLGYVNDISSSANPIEGAAVTARYSGPGLWTDQTDAAGLYSLLVPTGTFTVTAGAFGYLPQVVTGVQVLSGTITQQDLYLAPLPRFTVSGTVTETGTGAPLPALVRVLDTPLPAVWTDPATGFYSTTVPSGTFTLQVTATLHQPAARVVVADRDQVQDFSLDPRPCILLVDDDDNAPDVRGYYTTALTALGYDYALFDAGNGGGDGPTLAELEGHALVIWFTGDKAFAFGGGGVAGPNAADEAHLAAYLEGGGRLFLSSQDYLYDFGLTAFGQAYLGIDAFVDDEGDAAAKQGLPGDPVGDGLGPYPLLYPAGFADGGDQITPTLQASLAFEGDNGRGLDVDRRGSNWRTVTFGTSWVPIYHHDPTNGEEVLQRIVDWFGGCSGCRPVHDPGFTWAPPEPYSGQTIVFTSTATGTIPITYTWDFGDGVGGTGQVVSHVYTEVATYTVAMTATNCDADWVTATHAIVAATPPCTGVQALSLTLVTTGTVYTDTLVEFRADLAPEDAVKPYSYTVDYRDGTVITSSQSADPLVLTYTFRATGTFDVQVGAWNCDMEAPATGTVTLTVYEQGVCVDLSSVTVWGPTSGTIGIYTFHTTYEPLNATQPITYTWDDGGGGATHVRPLGWGTHTLVVTATNCAPAVVTGTHTVVITGQRPVYLPLVVRSYAGTP